MLSYCYLNLLQHLDLTVTSEERILNAIMMWGMKSMKLISWEEVDELLKMSTLEVLFEERIEFMGELLQFVRFALLPRDLLKKVLRTSRLIVESNYKSLY